MKFTYKADKTDPSVGFIAEEVPDLAATKDRKTLGPMDIVAVLTRVVQEQQKTIEKERKANQEDRKTIREQQVELDGLKAEVEKLKGAVQAR